MEVNSPDVDERTSPVEWRPVTLAIAALCVAVFVIELVIGTDYGAFLGAGALLPPPMALGVLTPAAVRAGEWWRLVSAGFLHVSVPQLLLSLIGLFSAGSYAEPRFGKRRFAAIYLASLIAGDALAFYTLPGQANSVGASGAVMGLFGAIATLGIQFGLEIEVLERAIGPLLVTLMIGLLPAGISNAAHLGGFLVGAAAAGVMGPAPTWAQAERAQAAEELRQSREDASRSEPFVKFPASVASNPKNWLVLEASAGYLGQRCLSLVFTAALGLLILMSALPQLRNEAWAVSRTTLTGLVVGVASIVWTVWGALTLQTRLTLTPLGFTVGGMRPRTVIWHDVDGFGTAAAGRGPEVATFWFTDEFLLRQPRHRFPLLPWEAQTLAPATGLSAQEQADLMERWRQQWNYGISPPSEPKDGKKAGQTLAGEMPLAPVEEDSAPRAPTPVARPRQRLNLP